MKKRAVKMNQNYESQVRVKQKRKGLIKNLFYDDSCLAMVFTRTGDENCSLPLRVVCGKKLSNTATVPAKLSHTSQITAATYQIKTGYFQRLPDSQNKESKVFWKKVTVSEKAQEASYLGAELIAQRLKVTLLLKA
jgi:hypothetical protein